MRVTERDNTTKRYDNIIRGEGTTTKGTRKQKKINSYDQMMREREREKKKENVHRNPKWRNCTYMYVCIRKYIES